MTKSIDECPVCHSLELEQEFFHSRHRGSLVIGGAFTSSPAVLDGCSCCNCGTRFKFNKKGSCPSCRGTGRYVSVTSRSGIEVSRTTAECPTCSGTGRIE